MKRAGLLFTAAGFLLCMGLIYDCKSLKPGECKNDLDCRGQVQGVGVCYKDTPDIEIGRCMTVKEARRAHERFLRKKEGTCQDGDGDGFKVGAACAPPLDCDDGDPKIKPGAEELCDSEDNNCDGVINEGLKGCVGTILGGKDDQVVGMVTTATSGVEVAPDGGIWVSDQHRIYRIAANGKASLVAGSHMPGSQDGQGASARFNDPRGMAVAPDGTVFIAECSNNCVRKLAPDGQVSVYAGKCSSQADDTGLDMDGTWSEARFWCPVDIAFDMDGSLLVVDMYNAKIKRISKGRRVTTVAGRGGRKDQEGYIVFGYKNGPALKAEFDQPAGIAVGSDGSVYIADRRNNCVRRLKNRKVGVFAGVCKNGSDQGGHRDGAVGKAKFSAPDSVDVGPDGAVYVADTYNHCIRKIQAGRVVTLAGTPESQGYYDGPVQEALFNGPQTISVAKDGSCYVADTGNYRVRRVIPR